MRKNLEGKGSDIKVDENKARKHKEIGRAKVEEPGRKGAKKGKGEKRKTTSRE